MLFNSLQFAAFFLAFLAVYHQLRGRSRAALLLVGSYVFYGLWDWRFLGLLALSTVVDFTIGWRLDRTDNARRRSGLLAVSMTVNLGLLGVFKYANFFVDSFAALLDDIGLEPNEPFLSIVLPVGISFYTFQTMSYTIDIYRRRLEPVRDLLVFATFVAYFPQLVAGPIERARVLLPQLVDDDRRVGPDRVVSGLSLILLGLFKKVVLADGVAGIADRAFDDPGSQSWVAAAAGVLAFAIQIYGDFSGYTDVARGVSRLLGIELTLNFTQPYLSRNITEFWRRWHISLSNWLRDYLYIPLGGKPRRPGADLPQPADDHAARRPVARCQLELRGVGWFARRLPHRPQAAPRRPGRGSAGRGEGRAGHSDHLRRGVRGLDLLSSGRLRPGVGGLSGARPAGRRHVHRRCRSRADRDGGDGGD